MKKPYPAILIFVIASILACTSSASQDPVLIAYNYYLTAGHYAIGLASGQTVSSIDALIEPIVDIGSPGSWKDEHVKDANLIAVGDSLYLFYSGADDPDGCYKIGLATSGDGGSTWQDYAGNPILSPSAGWESTGCASLQFPQVRLDGSTWYMWYSGGQWGAGGIGLATSPDGLAWTKNAGNPVVSPGSSGAWDDSYVNTGPVLYDGSYHLVYCGNDGDRFSVGVASASSPAASYTKSQSNPILSPDNITSSLTEALNVGTNAASVSSSDAFVPGVPVWVYDNAHHFLTAVVDRLSSTALELADLAPVTIAAGGEVRSIAYLNVCPNSIFAGEHTLDISIAAFHPYDGYLKELSLTAYGDLSDLEIDYASGLLVPVSLFASTGTSVSRENASVLQR